MTSSNGTSRKTSRNTWFAIGLASTALVVSGYLLFQVNSLDREYGHIRYDLPHLESLRESAVQQRDEARQQWIERQAEISILRDTKADLDAELADLTQARDSAEKREADAIERANDEQERLEAIQAQLSEAKSTIANAQPHSE
ncbi:hypothetical protein OEG86_23880 [Hoeflea alexandrii]|uniref:hypothetical protein n=1 Tax=Hoeflea alexandrii TaxID=288436 RepID=UPI00227208BC|nr:hypothetical protein [Hoeflea alexandrii]MCY0154756.1 hypothetical protein [Hoeflea alexandrii]